MLVQCIIGNVLNDSGRFFIIDKVCCSYDKFFRVILKLIKHGWLNAL